MMFSHRDSTSDDAYKPDRDQESAEISFSDMIFSSIMIGLGKYPVIQKLECGATIGKGSKHHDSAEKVSSDSETRALRNNLERY